MSRIDEQFTEIWNLRAQLEKHNIPFDWILRGDGYQIIIQDKNKKDLISVIQFSGSYGAEENFLEIMGLLTEEELKGDTVVGWLTANDVFKRINQYWEENKNE